MLSRGLLKMVLGENTDWDCVENVLKPVKRIERDGFQDLLYEDEERRVELWNRLEECRDFFKDNDACGADSNLYKEIESRLALARLKLATSLNETSSFPDITKKFSEIELGLFKIIEEFRFFDDYSTGEIKDKIGRQDGKVYDIVKNYSTKIDTRREQIFENPEIKPGIAIAIKNLLKERTDKIQEAVIEYTQVYGVVNTTNQIESAVKKVSESEQKRDQISAEVQEKLDRLEDELDDARSAASLKDDLENKLVEIEKQLIRKDFEKELFRNKIENLENEKGSIVDRYSSLEDVMRNRMQEVEEKQKELVAKEDEIHKLRSGIRSELRGENDRILQGELDKIKQMRNDIQSQLAAIDDEKQLLESQREEIDDKFNEIKKAVEGGGSGNRFVPRDLAKLYEMDYIGRFDMKMHELPLNMTNPVNGKKYTVKSWGDDHTKMDEKDMIYNLFKKEMSISEIETQIPLNVRSRYEIWERRFKLIGKKEPTTIIEAMIFNHWKEYASNGFDTKPVILSELNSVLVRLINNAERGKYFHVIAIASPTGWDERIKIYIKSDEFAKNYVSRYISICLVDNETGELTYNETDGRITGYIDLFEPKFDSEKVMQCKEHIKGEHNYDNHVALDDIINETGLGMDIVKKAFYELESEGRGEVRFISDMGVVLSEM